MTLLEQEIQQRFIKEFGNEPLLVRSPGRINLIGEHTDYNQGFVMPAAIDKEIAFAISASNNGTSKIVAHDYNQWIDIDLASTNKVKKPAWANYLLGVLHKIQESTDRIKPFNCVFGGNIPSGAGLSSSAALECGFAFALNELFGLEIPRLSIVSIGQWAEHNFVGVKCGIMDQFASVMSKRNHVIILDCRSLEYEYAPLNLGGYEILLCDTRVKHSLVDSEYNTRRNECEEGVKVLQRHYPAIDSLRDVKMEMLETHRDQLKGKVFDRCSYVVAEIARVQSARIDLEKGDLEAFGRKMFETHRGLSQLYEVSCPELDFLVNEVSQFEYVIGARMMGGGFGGCTINLVEGTNVEILIQYLASAYREAFNIDMKAYRVRIEPGTSVLMPSTVQNNQ